jgi:hypothetical protein
VTGLFRGVSMEKHVTNVCKATNFHIRNIGAIRNVLSDSSTEKLVHAMITSRLDYCNVLLSGIPDSQIQRLQRLQNNAARIVCKIKKYDHITPTLKKLHWLPVKERICFKILLLTYKALNGKAPAYITELLCPYNPPRSLRSGDKHLLTIPRSRTKTYGDRTFSSRAPKEWNCLPHHLRMVSSLEAFKRDLKTHLFKHAYE